jgi:hypothetical protein
MTVHSSDWSRLGSSFVLQRLHLPSDRSASNSPRSSTARPASPVTFRKYSWNSAGDHRVTRSSSHSGVESVAGRLRCTAVVATVIAAGGYAPFAAGSERSLGPASTTTGANAAILEAMATLPLETFTPVLRGAGRCGSSVPSVTAAIAEMVSRIGGYLPARGIPLIPETAPSEEFSRSVASRHRIVCLRGDLHTLQDAGAEHAAMCARIFNGSAL